MRSILTDGTVSCFDPAYGEYVGERAATAAEKAAAVSAMSAAEIVAVIDGLRARLKVAQSGRDIRAIMLARVPKWVLGLFVPQALLAAAARV